MNVLVYEDKYQLKVTNLIVNIQSAEFNIPISAGDQPDLNDIKNFYQNHKGNFWIAIKDEDVIGTIALLDLGKQAAALRKMFVKKEFRGNASSVANTLLSTVIKHASENNIQSIYLGTTSSFLAAHRFYEKNGFIEITTQELPANFPIMAVDTKFYHYPMVLT